MSFNIIKQISSVVFTLQGCACITYFGTGCGFSTSLKSNEHDDIVFAFGGSPGFHTRINQLLKGNTHFFYVSTFMTYNKIHWAIFCIHCRCIVFIAKVYLLSLVLWKQLTVSFFFCLILLPFHQSLLQIWNITMKNVLINALFCWMSFFNLWYFLSFIAEKV